MFAFSSIWLIGRHLPLYISKFPKVTLQQAFFLFGLLFLAARIEYTTVYYCVIKFLVFTIVALPIFAFCLQERPEKNNAAPLKWYYPAILYIVLLAGIRFFSHSLPSSKLVYSVAPIATLGLSFLMTARVRSVVLKLALFLGYISYSLYMIHYPIQIYISRYTEKLNGMAVLVVALIIILPLAWLGQKGSERIFSKGHRGKSGKPKESVVPVVSETAGRV
jgi:peptidoglycan/LPS O-acetylase OafA/YrhL